MNRPASDHGLSRAAFHAGAAIALLVPIAALQVSSWAADDTRVRLFRCTFIFHATGEIVIRLPSGGLVKTGLLMGLAPGPIYLACVAYLAGWVILMTATWVGDRRRRRDRPRRGSSLD